MIHQKVIQINYRFTINPFKQSCNRKADNEYSLLDVFWVEFAETHGEYLRNSYITDHLSQGRLVRSATFQLKPKEFTDFICLGTETYLISYTMWDLSPPNPNNHPIYILYYGPLCYPGCGSFRPKKKFKQAIQVEGTQPYTYKKNFVCKTRSKFTRLCQ